MGLGSTCCCSLPSTVRTLGCQSRNLSASLFSLSSSQFPHAGRIGTKPCLSSFSHQARSLLCDIGTDSELPTLHQRPCYEKPCYPTAVHRPHRRPATLGERWPTVIIDDRRRRVVGAGAADHQLGHPRSLHLGPGRDPGRGPVTDLDPRTLWPVAGRGAGSTMTGGGDGPTPPTRAPHRFPPAPGLVPDLAPGDTPSTTRTATAPPLTARRAK